MAEATYRIRFKGIVSGPHTRSSLLARLAAGEASLAHCVEHRGRWVTLRAFLRETGAPSSSTSPAPSESVHGEIPPPPPAPGAVDLGLDRLTQRAYLWCGLTFGLPFVAVLVLWGVAWSILGHPPAGSISLALGLTAVALVSTSLARHQARSSAAELERDGLGDVARSVRKLVDLLAIASALLWLVAGVVIA